MLIYINSAERLKNLQKAGAKLWQRISDLVIDDNLENTIVSIFKDSEVEVDPRDIEACHRLPLPRNSRGQDKKVIAKSVNQKHSEALLRDKKHISNKSFRHLNVSNKVISVYFCPYYRYIWGKCKDLQRQGQVNHVFNLGNVVCIKLSEKLVQLNCTITSDIPDFQSKSVTEN